MYSISKNIKYFGGTLVVTGLILIIIGFNSAPSNINEARAIVSSGHHDTHQVHETDGHAQSGISEEVSHAENTTHNDSHDSHLLSNLKNKPWAAFYVAAFFFMMIALGVLAFYAVQRVAQAGWSIVLFRVMEAITAYLLPGALIVFVVLLLSSMHLNHLFVWMDPEVVANDEILQNKQGYLNTPFFLIRAIIFIMGWSFYRFISRKYSLAQDSASDLKYHKKNFKLSAAFLVFYIVTESVMSWDWIMSLDPHWFSTLFGWYVFASMFVTGITVIAMVTIYLKSKGYLEMVNQSHIHDLGKFMFAFSVFWTYLWFSQFMLIWYSNIPEEVTYFLTRIEDYNITFFGMFFLNFVFPILILMNSDYKRVNYFIVMAGSIIILGHYVDIFNMIMPSTVGKHWSFGIPEIGSFMFFFGLFVLIVFKALTKAPLLPKGDPYIKESKQYHY